jgi:hypothetical protein
MSSTVFQIASVAAGLAVLAADCAVFLLPLGKMKDLARGLAITVSLGLRSFSAGGGPQLRSLKNNDASVAHCL